MTVFSNRGDYEVMNFFPSTKAFGDFWRLHSVSYFKLLKKDGLFGNKGLAGFPESSRFKMTDGTFLFLSDEEEM